VPLVSLNRRRALAAVPLLVMVAGCRSSALFAGPDPLGGPPALAADTATLEDAITAERALISLYSGFLGNHASRLLEPMLAHHNDHLAQLTSRLLVPSGFPSPSASASGSASASPAAVTMDALRAAEQQSCTAMLARLPSVPPDLAQLFASIAACDATHAMALTGATP
jgi:hypothetical protein